MSPYNILKDNFMCGFLSAFSKNYIENSSLHKLRAASKLIQHRGPDDSSEVHLNFYFSLFHRLSIRDLSTSSRQPVFSNCKRYIICFNGEIYNISELSRLFLLNAKFKSDTLLLSNLVSERGIDAVHLLRGMFAISIYDTLKSEFYLIRDSFGIKPLFYFKSEKDNYIYASSEIKALLHLKKNKSPDIIQCSRFLKMGVSNDIENTFFDEIKSVPKGHIMAINKDFHIRFTKLSSNLDNFNLSYSNPFDSKRHDSFLTDIIREHLISDVPIATTISGGIDSSVVSLNVEKYSIKNNMFSAFSESFDSEITDKRLVEYKDKLINIDCTLTNTSEYIDEIIKKLSAPFESSSWIYQDILMKEISTDFKYKVLLVGEGADEVYSGYKRLFYPYLFSLELAEEKDLLEQSITGFSAFLGINKEEILRNYYLFSESLNSKTDYEDQIYSKYFFNDGNNFDYERYFPSFEQISSNDPEIFYKKHLLSYLNRADIPSTLYVLDVISMSYGIELRVPFLDIKLFEEVMNYSFKYHFNRGFNKYILRKSSSILDKEIRWNKLKKQRPTAVSSLIYDTLNDEILYLLSQENILINTNTLKKDFILSRQIRSEKFARFMFRVYTFLKFWYLYF